MTEEQFQAHMELQSANYIQLCRIYDFMTVIADKLGIDAIAIKNMHTEGGTFSPFPALVENDTDEE